MQISNRKFDTSKVCYQVSRTICLTAVAFTKKKVMSKRSIEKLPEGQKIPCYFFSLLKLNCSVELFLHSWWDKRGKCIPCLQQGCLLVTCSYCTSINKQVKKHSFHTLPPQTSSLKLVKEKSLKLALVKDQRTVPFLPTSIPVVSYISPPQIQQ